MELLKKNVLLSNIVNGSYHTKCVLLSNQKFMTHVSLINYILVNSQESHYYLFAVKLDVLEVKILWIIYLIKYVL